MKIIKACGIRYDVSRDKKTGDITIYDLINDKKTVLKKYEGGLDFCMVWETIINYWNRETCNSRSIPHETDSYFAHIDYLCVKAIGA